MLRIQCCKDCVPPKRHPGCGADCPEYKKEKAEMVKLNAEIRKASKPVLSEYDFNKDLSRSLRKKR